MAGGKVTSCAIGLTNVGDTALFAKDAAAILTGSSLDDATVGKAVAAAEAITSPAADAPRTGRIPDEDGRRHAPPRARPRQIAGQGLREGTMAKTQVSMKVNGKQVDALVEPRTLLIHFLRENLSLTGPHIGCETSHCGACTVDLDGKSVKACTRFAVQADGAEIITIEGIANPDGTLHALQEGFREMHGLQCGFCTPGMITRAYRLLQENPQPTEDEIRHGISGNICRCTGYQNIVRAIQYAAAKLAGVPFQEAAE